MIFKTKLFLQQKKKERFRFSKRFNIITKFDNFAGIKLSVCCHQLISSGWDKLEEIEMENLDQRGAGGGEVQHFLIYIETSVEVMEKYSLN